MMGYTSAGYTDQTKHNTKTNPPALVVYLWVWGSDTLVMSSFQIQLQLEKKEMR